MMRCACTIIAAPQVPDNLHLVPATKQKRQDTKTIQRAREGTKSLVEIISHVEVREVLGTATRILCGGLTVTTANIQRGAARHICAVAMVHSSKTTSGGGSSSVSGQADEP